MNIHIKRVEGTIQYFCHTAKFSRADFGSAEIERAVNEAARDSAGEEDFWITLTTPGMDSWEYLVSYRLDSWAGDSGQLEGFFADASPSGYRIGAECADSSSANWRVTTFAGPATMEGWESAPESSCHSRYYL